MYTLKWTLSPFSVRLTIMFSSGLPCIPGGVGITALSPSSNSCDHNWPGERIETMAFNFPWHSSTFTVNTALPNGLVSSSGDVQVTLLHFSLNAHVPLLSLGNWIPGQLSSWFSSEKGSQNTRYQLLFWPFHFHDLISNSPYCMSYNPYDVRLGNLVLDQLIIP